MIAEPLSRVLDATGYLTNGTDVAPGVTLFGSPQAARLPSFGPDAWWRSQVDPARDTKAPDGVGSGLTVYFKYVDEPRDASVADWQREIWNQGFSPLLWVVSPDRIDLYNGFGEPRSRDDAAANRLRTFRRVEAELAQLDTLAGRLAMETGQFWRQERRVRRETSVDHRLLRDLGNLERALLRAELGRDEAQALIGRCVFTKYLIDRKIVTGSHFDLTRGHDHLDLTAVLRDPGATSNLFAWLRDTFNGDMFPPLNRGVRPEPEARHLDVMARFLEGEDLSTGQRSLFPYRFEVIPVELVSSIYEQFVHSASSATSVKSMGKQDVYYTPLAAVSLVLDEVFDGLTGSESVLDLSCGSGVFLVESLRRLVYLRARGAQPSRELIREVLYEQVYGVDISEAAVRIAAFSLYLAALELDPDPQPPEALGFEPLQGRTLLVGDARTIEDTPAGREVLRNGSAPSTQGDAPGDVDGDGGREAGLRRFDVIVGNPPWSYTGRAGTAARRAAASGAALQPRGQSLDFVARARDFAHDGTRFGMILSATPFFGRSATAVGASRDIVDALAPVTLVNLSELSRWLFPRANMPAVAFIGRNRDQRANRMTLVQARWSPAGERSHTIEIAPSDVATLPIASWKRHAGLFKASFLGRRPDVLLLDELWEAHKPLAARLEAAGTRLRAGLKSANRSRDAAFLKGLPFVDKGSMRPFSLPDEALLQFDQDRAERPRERDTYRAPLLLVAEFLRGGPRPVTAVSERDTVFTDACFGVSFPGGSSDTACLAAGVLASALASWFFLMTGSAFGLWMRRLLLKDIEALPVPALDENVGSNAGKRVIELVRAFRKHPPDADDWRALDEAVFDLYELHDPERLIMRSGLDRATWQWKAERERSVAPATLDDLREYAKAFLSTMDAWFSARKKRRMRAEIYDLREAPHRIVRFVIEDQPGPSVVKLVRPDGPLRSVLERIGERAHVRVTDELVGARELRVHAGTEVSIVKPAARRHWLGVCGFEDADLVVEDSVYGERAE